MMQPSLKRVLANERLSRLDALGWTFDPSFGNYVRAFPSNMPTDRVAEHILQTLKEVYDADPSALELQTSWVADMQCPPRNGPSQNLAGIVNDAPQMRSTAVRTCSYKPAEDSQQRAASAKELVALYGANTAVEIQRLRVNAARPVYVIFDAGIGYIQCKPDISPPTIYCEAQSAESWPALASILTAERVSLPRGAGYADPGRGPNYSKTYPLDKFSDTAIATELLTILYEVYGYTGAMKLEISTE